MGRKSYLFIGILGLLVICYGNFVIIVDNNVKQTFVYSFLNIEFHPLALIAIKTGYHVVFGFICSYIVRPQIDLNKNVSFWVISTFLIIIILIPAIYFSNRFIAGLIFKLYGFGSVSNIILLARVLFGILIGGYIQEAVKSKKVSRTNVI